MERLSGLSKDKISELSTTLRLHDEGGSAWRELLMTNIGQEKMESIRSTAQQLLELETQRHALGSAPRPEPLGLLAPCAGVQQRHVFARCKRARGRRCGCAAGRAGGGTGHRAG